MGFNLFKKRDKAVPTPPLKPPTTAHLLPPSPTSPSSISASHLRPKKGSSNSSLNPFRTSSVSTIDVRSAPPLSPTNLTPTSNGTHRSSFDHRPTAQRDNPRRKPSAGSWDDLGVPLAGDDADKASRTSHDLGPPDRSRLWGRAKVTASSLSLPLPLLATEPHEEAPQKKGRWHLGRGPKARSNSGASWGSDSGKDKHHEDGGFVVKSFRQVSRVQVDPISPGPYESMPKTLSPPLPALPLHPSPITSHPYHPSPAESHPYRPALNVRAPAPAANSWAHPERSSSPTISVEAFRLASSRSKSTVSLASIGSLGEDRPRFEPTPRGRRGSVGIEVLESSPLAPPRPQFVGSGSHSRQSSSDSSIVDRDQRDQSRLPPSDSITSVASYTTAVEGTSSFDELPRISPSELDSWDDDLKLIAMYGVGGSPPNVKTPLPSPSQPPRRRGASAPNASTSSSSPSPSPSPSPSRYPHSNTLPALALLPATPTPSVPSSHSTPQTQQPRSMLSPSSARSPSSPVSPISKRKGKAPKGWESSSDEDSDDEDDVPLARLGVARASASDLALNTRVPVAMEPKSSSEQEILSISPPRVSTDSPTSGHIRAFSATDAVVSLRRPMPGEGRGSQRRSMSTFSLSTTHGNLSSVAPGEALQTPTIGHRTYSNPARPEPETLLRPAFSATDLPLLLSSNRTSTQSSNTPPHHFSSSSSGSGSSAPTTPKENSPHQSILGLKPAPLGSFDGGSKVKFDVSSLNNDAERKWKSRVSIQGPLGLGRPSVVGGAPPRSASVANFTPPSRPRLSNINNTTTTNTASESLASRRPRQTSAPTAEKTTNGGDVYDRMKVRHKAETFEAERIGKDLNGPSGRVHDAEEDDEDDDVPLTALSQHRGSQVGGGSAYRGSQFGQQQQQQQQQQQHFFPPPSSIGGYSQLASAPPGVDPYLYASLPPDQKMSLHARSQQMMQLMAQAAYQAKAESVGGWDTGSQAGSASGGSQVGGAGPPHQPQLAHSMSMGNFPMLAFGSPMMGGGGGGMGIGMGGMGMGGFAPSPQMMMGGPGMGYGSMGPMPGSRLPPFAPSMAASQPFFQQPTYAYAGSAVGFAPYGQGGGGGGQPQGGQRRVPASTIGIGARR